MWCIQGYVCVCVCVRVCGMCMCEGVGYMCVGYVRVKVCVWCVGCVCEGVWCVCEDVCV